MSGIIARFRMLDKGGDMVIFFLSGRLLAPTDQGNRTEGTTTRQPTVEIGGDPILWSIMRSIRPTGSGSS